MIENVVNDRHMTVTLKMMCCKKPPPDALSVGRSSEAMALISWTYIEATCLTVCAQECGSIDN